VLFTAQPEFRDEARGVGEFLPLPVEVSDVLRVIRGFLQPIDATRPAA
jgi:hypothetical protein